jgi:hypothetical protein
MLVIRSVLLVYEQKIYRGFVMNKTSLLTALRLSKPALGAGALISGLDCYYFSHDEVTAYNGALGIVANIGFEFPCQGYIAGAPFYKLFNELEGEISLAVSRSGETNTVLVKSGSTRATFPCLALNGVLWDPAERSRDDVQLPKSAMFLSGIKKCLVSLSAKGMSAEEAGIHLFIEEGNCELFSMSTNSISKYGFSLEAAGEDTRVLPAKLSLLLPAAFCEITSYLFTELLSCPDEMSAGAEIRALFPKIGLYSSFFSASAQTKVKATFESYALDTPLIPVPKGLTDALKRAETVVGSLPIEVTYGPKLTLRAFGGAGVGEVIETLEAPYPSDGKVKIEAEQLRKALVNCASLGFGSDYMMLEGADRSFIHIIAGVTQ